jgi:hypothetical protein
MVMLLVQYVTSKWLVGCGNPSLVWEVCFVMLANALPQVITTEKQAKEEASSVALAVCK